MSNKKNLLATMAKTDTGAPLVETKQATSKKMKKTLNALPESYFEAHKAAKSKGKTGLDFSAYIYEALREKLAKDGLL